MTDTAGKRKGIIAACIAAGVVAVLVATLSWPGAPSASPFGDDATWDTTDDREAARVNDVTITEGQVTASIQALCEALGIESSSAWEGYLQTQQLSAEGMRNRRLSELVEAEVVRQAAAQEEVEVSDAEVKQEVERLRTEFVSGQDLPEDEAWQNVLRLNGYSDVSFEEHTRSQLVEKALARKVGIGETYRTWIANFRDSCTISTSPAPADLPYLTSSQD